MRRRSYSVYKEIEVDVELDDFDDEDLLEELEERGAAFPDKSLVRVIYEKRRMGQDYQAELDQLIYECLGKII